MEAWLAAILLGVVFGAMGWLLSSKDKKQGDDIDTLYSLCHAQQKELSEHKLKIAENHYPKHELDQRFQQLNITLAEGFRGLSSDVKEMTKMMHDHLREHHNRDGQ